MTYYSPHPAPLHLFPKESDLRMAAPPKQKGDACNRCKARRVRCTGSDGQPCYACLRSGEFSLYLTAGCEPRARRRTLADLSLSLSRTAKFKGHDLDKVICSYHGSNNGRCSEEGDAPASRGELQLVRCRGPARLPAAERGREDRRLVGG